MFSSEHQSARRIIIFAGTILAIAVLQGFPRTASAQDEASIEVLVVGDSHISGQGLRQENKFYFLVTEWLKDDIVELGAKVDLKVKAHAGSRLNLHPDELEAMRKSGEDVDRFHFQEANLSSPSIRTQIDVARAEYKDPYSVDLVMLSGCITDVLVAYIVNPFYPEKKLRHRVDRFCGESMAGLLEHTANAFPNAHIVVVGYFPIASSNSDIKTMVRYFAKTVSFPQKLQFIFTNPVSRQPLRLLRNKIADRSRIWLTGSNRAIRKAVKRVNDRIGRPRILFVESPIDEDSSYATKKPLLWEIGKDHLPNDETYNERKVGCAKVFGEMKYKHYGRLSTRMCELSSVAHPNIEGSKAYAEAIINALKATAIASQTTRQN